MIWVIISGVTKTLGQVVTTVGQSGTEPSRSRLYGFVQLTGVRGEELSADGMTECIVSVIILLFVVVNLLLSFFLN